jgi:hypothetical protein
MAARDNRQSVSEEFVIFAQETGRNAGKLKKKHRFSGIFLAKKQLWRHDTIQISAWPDRTNLAGPGREPKPRMIKLYFWDV